MSVCVCACMCAHMRPRRRVWLGSRLSPLHPRSSHWPLPRPPSPRTESLWGRKPLWSSSGQWWRQLRSPRHPGNGAPVLLCSLAGPVCTQTGRALAPRLGQTSQAQRCVQRGRRKGTRRDGGQRGGLPSVCLRLAHAQRTRDTRTVRNRRPPPGCGPEATPPPQGRKLTVAPWSKG